MARLIKVKCKMFSLPGLQEIVKKSDHKISPLVTT